MPKSRCSHGEQMCSMVLKELNIPFLCEYSISLLPAKRFDFMFEINGRKYLLEFDGVQHFKYVPLFHHDVETFKDKQNIDKIKTNSAIKEGFTVIRIDDSQINNIKFHIELGISSTSFLYLSCPEKYQFLF